MILEFRTGGSRSAVREVSELDDSVARGAEIIIFPGVRREHHAEAAPPRPRRREKARTKRDRIEIPD